MLSPVSKASRKARQRDDGFRKMLAADHLNCVPEDLVSAPDGRVVMVAPHPDDEVLALGATMASLACSGHPLAVFAVTDGEASHPASSQWTARRLRDERPRESAEALSALGISAPVVRMGLPDGAVPRHEEQLAALLSASLHASDTVFVPWRFDGHADHEASARAVLAACRTVGARCIEFPVWALVPGHPAHARLAGLRLRRIGVPQQLAQAKVRAIAAFRSQIEADGLALPVLTSEARAVWQQGAEWVMA